METAKSPGLSKFVKALIVLILVVVIAFFAMITSVSEMFGRVASSDGILGGKKPHLTLLKIEGPILESEKTLDILANIADNAACKGLLVRIDSPGGAVGSSQEIFAALKRLRERGLPVIVSFGNVAASGGYYIALAGETIFSNPGTLTGSIGVIFQFPEAEKLMEKVGVSLQTVKSGALKDIGNPGRKPTPAELRFLQGVIDDTYAQFLSDVAASRHIDIDSLRPYADGRVMTGRQAVKLGLVDSLGGLDVAKRFLIRRAKQEADVPWEEQPKPKSRLQDFLDPESQSSLSRWLTGMTEKLSPGAFFLWR